MQEASRASGMGRGPMGRGPMGGGGRDGGYGGNRRPGPYDRMGPNPLGRGYGAMGPQGGRSRNFKSEFLIGCIFFEILKLLFMFRL